MCNVRYVSLDKAKSVLTSLLVDLYRQASRRRRLRVVTVEEYPWRAQVRSYNSACIYDCACVCAHCILRVLYTRTYVHACM